MSTVTVRESETEDGVACYIVEPELRAKSRRSSAQSVITPQSDAASQDTRPPPLPPGVAGVSRRGPITTEEKDQSRENVRTGGPSLSSEYRQMTNHNQAFANLDTSNIFGGGYKKSKRRRKTKRKRRRKTKTKRKRRKSKRKTKKQKRRRRRRR